MRTERFLWSLTYNSNLSCSDLFGSLFWLACHSIPCDRPAGKEVGQWAMENSDDWKGRRNPACWIQRLFMLSWLILQVMKLTVVEWDSSGRTTCAPGDTGPGLRTWFCLWPFCFTLSRSLGIQSRYHGDLVAKKQVASVGTVLSLCPWQSMLTLFCT